MFLVELVVVVITQLRAEQLLVLVADNDRTAFVGKGENLLVGKELSCILQSFIVVAESANDHTLQSFHLLGSNGKVSHDKVREVVFCQFIEQLVLVNRVSLVSNDEREVNIPFRSELTCFYRIAVAHHHTSSCPDVADVKLSSMQFPSLLNAVYNHSGEVTHFTLRVFVDHRLHVVDTSLGISLVEFRHTVEEDKLVAVSSKRESLLGYLDISLHLSEAVSLKGIVGACIERILDMNAKLSVLYEIRVGEKSRPLAVGESVFKFCYIRGSHIRLMHSTIEQEQVIVRLVHVFIVSIFVSQSSQRLFAQRQIVEFILKDNAGVEQSVHNRFVTFCDLFLRERNLCQIILPFVRVVLCTVSHILDRILHCRHISKRVAHLVGHLVNALSLCDDSFVDTLPVVHILSLSPKFLESRLTLVNSHLVIEIPECILLISIIVLRIIISVIVVETRITAVFSNFLLRFSFRLSIAFRLFLLLQSLDNAVDGSVAFLFRHLGKRLQRVLQVYRLGIRYEFIKNLRSFRQLFVVLTILVEQSDSLPIAALCIAIVLFSPIDIAQSKQQYTLLNAISCRLGITLFVGINSLNGILLRHVDISDSIVNLVEILLVVVVSRHTLQFTHHLFPLTARHNLSHGDTGVKFQLVGRVLPDNPLICLVSLKPVAEHRLQLSHDIPFACPLLPSTFMADNLTQIRHRLGISPGFDIIVGISIIPVFHCPPVHGVAAHLVHHVLSIIKPVLLSITSCEPSPCLAVDSRLSGIQPAHICESRGSLVEVTLHKLRASHQEPRLPEKRVVFLTVKPFDILSRLLS